MQKKTRVLITDGGTVNALAIVRHLGLKNEYDLYVTGSNKLALSRYSKYCKKYFVVPHPKKEASLFNSDLKSIITSFQIDFLMPVGFYSHMAVINDQHSFDLLCKTCLPQLESFEIATSKVLTSQVAQTVGVLVPLTKMVKTFDELQAISGLRYPVVIKSQKEIGGRMVEYANSHEDLIRKFKTLVDSHQLKPENYPIIQEYIEGTGVGFFAFYKDGKLQRSFMHERVREFPVSGGRSVCARSVNYPDLAKSGTALLDALQWNGCAMVEYKKTNSGEYFLLEINPKLWGSLELAICAGVNFPELMIKNEVAAGLNAPSTFKEDLYFQWILNGELYHLINRPKNLFAIITTAFKSKKDFWFKDIKPNLMQVLLIFVDLYKVIKSRH